MSTRTGDLLVDVAAANRPNIAALSDALSEQMLREIPELAGDGPLEQLLGESVRANVSAILDAVESGIGKADLEAPAAAIEYARRLAQRGVPISALLRAYRIGQGSFMHQMSEGVTAASATREAVVRALLDLSSITFAYIDRIAEQVVVAYQAERDRWMNNRGALRGARVRSILAGGAVDIDDAESALGYPLRTAHRGVVVWGEENWPQAERLIRLERVVRRLAETFSSERAPLVVTPDDSTIWAWLPTAAPGGEIQVEEGTWIALGEPAIGVDGFRRSHRQAMQAHAVALASDPESRARVTRTLDVGVVALMCSDLDALRGWIQSVLGDLAIDDDNMARLRETVRVFLATAGSFTAAAKTLNLHKNTVQYRIRKAEEIRGRPLSDARLEVEVALLATHVLGGSVLVQLP